MSRSKNYPSRFGTRRRPLAGLIILVVLALGLILPQMAAASATNYVGDLATKRLDHTATLLPNGKVLVVGGLDNTTSLYALNSAELYDPATGAWTPTGNLSTGRKEHTATLLPNGKVLVAGGVASSGGYDLDLASAELYDPATGLWTGTGNLNLAHVAHTATLLQNGKVLVVGGWSNTILSETSAELYDPGTGNWTQVASMTARRTLHTATLLPNGQVLVVGGEAIGEHPGEVYNPVHDNWTATGPLNIAGDGATATLLPNGKVLLVGGNVAPSQAQLYDPWTNIWTGTTSTHYTHFGHTATLLPNGKVMVAGGGSWTYLEIYDPATGTWDITNWARQNRRYHTATLLASGQVLLAAGMDPGTGYAVKNTETYDPANLIWPGTGSLNITRMYHTATLLPDGQVLAAGGWEASCELYDPAKGTWSLTAPMHTVRNEHTATLLPCGLVLVVGGYSYYSSYQYHYQDSAGLASCELYDPVRKTWTFTSSLATGRYHHTATLLADGRVLVAGGTDNGSNILASAEIYDPARGTWSKAGDLNGKRCYHAATLLSNGQVLAAGGSDFDFLQATGGDLASCELYNPLTGSWSPTWSLNRVASRHTATLLPNGKVLVVGYNSYYGSAAELYDGTRWVYTKGAPTNTYYVDKAVLLANGQVLVCPGAFYDPAADSFKEVLQYLPSDPTHYDLYYQRGETATLLRDGKVLLAGGDISQVGGHSYISEKAFLFQAQLGFAEDWRPALGAWRFHNLPGDQLWVEGLNFRGFNWCQASGGATNDSPSNYPLVQLMRYEGNMILPFLPMDNFDAYNGTFTSKPLGNFPVGQYLVTVFVNGIPSLPSLLQFGPTAPIPPKPYMGSINHLLLSD